MEAAEQLGIRIPRLCYHPDLSLAGSCRVCIVDVKGMGFYMASCSVAGLGRDGGPDQLARDPPGPPRHRRAAAGQPPQGLPDLRARRQLRAAEPGLLAGRARAALRGPAQAVPHRGLQPLRGPRRGEVHPLRPLRAGVRGDPGRVQPQPARPRVPHRRRPRPTWPTWTTRSASSAGSASTSAPRPPSWRSASTEDVWEALANPDMHVVVQTAPSIRAAIGEGFGLAAGHAGHGQDGHRPAACWASTPCSTPTSAPT